MLPPSEGRQWRAEASWIVEQEESCPSVKADRATRIIPAFSSSRFLAASALCCRIRAKRSAREILSETTKYLKKKNSSWKVSNKLINYRQGNKPSALKDHEGGKSYEQVKSRKQGMKPIYEKILIRENQNGKTKRGNKYENLLNINKWRFNRLHLLLKWNT